MNIVIIEDEIFAQEELARIIEKNFPHMKVLDTLSSVEESIKWFSAHKANLVFMDIHLSDGICFDIFKQVDIHTPIIFTTAYDQYAIQAFKVNGVGYLLKPIDEGELIDAVTRFEHNSLDIKKLLEYFNRDKEYKDRIVVKLGDKISFLEIKDIAYFFAEDRLTFAVATNDKKYIVDYTIEALESVLNPKSFFKLTRGCITSIKAINTISKHFNSRLKVTLVPEYKDELLVSRMRVPDFIKWLNGE